jgi:hypothetical protein
MTSTTKINAEAYKKLRGIKIKRRVRYLVKNG